MASFNSKNKNKEKLAFVYVENEDLRVAVIDPATEKCVDSILIKKETTVDNISKQLISPKFKAIFLATSGFKPAGYSCNYEFCKELKTKFNAAKIPSHFFTDLQWHLSGLLIYTGFVPKVDDLVIFVTEFGEYNIFVYKFTGIGYIHLIAENVDISTSNSNKKIRDEFFKLCCLAAIFISADIAVQARLKKIFKNWKVFCSDKKLLFEPQHIIQHLKFLCCKNFLVQPICSVKLALMALLGTIKQPFITYKIGQPLPSIYTMTTKKFVNLLNLSLKDKDDEIITTLATWLPDQNCHQHEVTLAIDDEGFVDCQIKAVLFPHVELLPGQLNERFKAPHIPVITFVENLSFISIRKDTGYEYLKSWNGSLGMDLYISFDEEKPKYFQDALEIVRTKPTFVVFGKRVSNRTSISFSTLIDNAFAFISDIFHIMSQSPDNVEQLVEYRFKITKDADHPVLFEFDHYGETKKFSTPAFLMALLLKQHLKAIKEETGEKPREIAIFTFVDFDKEEHQRVRTQFTEACEMLKISCIFLDYDKIVQRR